VLPGVKRLYIDVARVHRAPRPEAAYKVILLTAAPKIFAGIRVEFTYTVVAVIGTKFLLVIGKRYRWDDFGPVLRVQDDPAVRRDRADYVARNDIDI